MRDDPLQDGEYYAEATLHDSLIAAVPQSMLFGDWINEFVYLEDEFSRLYRWGTNKPTIDDIRHFIYEKSIKIVMQRTERNLKSAQSVLHSSHYYGLRQMNFMQFGARVRFFGNQIVQKEINIMTETSVEYENFMSGPFNYSEQMRPQLIQ